MLVSNNSLKISLIYIKKNIRNTENFYKILILSFFSLLLFSLITNYIFWLIKKNISRLSNDS